MYHGYRPAHLNFDNWIEIFILLNKVKNSKISNYLLKVAWYFER